MVRQTGRVPGERPKLTGVYDLAPDGKRVVALMPVATPEAQQTQNHVIFLENFSDELRRKVPMGKQRLSGDVAARRRFNPPGRAVARDPARSTSKPDSALGRQASQGRSVFDVVDVTTSSHN